MGVIGRGTTGRIYRRMDGVRGVPIHHTVVLCGVDRDGRMATASGVDLEDAKANVDRKLDETVGSDEEGSELPWPGEPVRVNQWSAVEIARAAHISEHLAVAVVQYRREHGPFKRGPDIGKVPHDDREGLMRLAAVADYQEDNGRPHAPKGRASDTLKNMPKATAKEELRGS